LTGKSGRKTANACDESANDTRMNAAADFMFVVKITSQKVDHPGAAPLPTFAKRYYGRLLCALVFRVSV
jgi:hypothetical protein